MYIDPCYPPSRGLLFVDVEFAVELVHAPGIEEDQTKKDYLFTSFAKAWFPRGATDPDLALLQVNIGHAEYWDVKESKMMQLFKMAQAVITGDPPDKLGEHKELSLS